MPGLTGQPVCSAAREEPNNEDNEDEDGDAVKDGQTSKLTELLEPLCSRVLKVNKGGSYKWTCLVCSLSVVFIGSIKAGKSA